MSKKIWITAAFLLSIKALFAQGIFKFEKTEHDFGTVVEGNIASYEFEFTNTGNQPIIISNVRASCGCTTPYWTKEPVLPGQKGKIKAAYNSKGRPGAFNKSITITSNASQPSARLSIKGNVERPTAEPKYTEEELAMSPKIRFEQNAFNLGKVEMGQSVAKKITVYNDGKSPLTFKDMQSTCNCVSLLGAPEEIAPGGKGEVEISVTPRLVAKRNESIHLFTNDITKSKATVHYTIEVVKDLSGTSLMQNPDNSNPFK